MATPFNIDELKHSFEPVEVIFRGSSHVLGRNALGLLEACEMCDAISSKDGIAYMKAQFNMLPELVEKLSPGFQLPDDIESGEQLALIKACWEVIGRIGQFSFQEDEPESGDGA